MRVPKAAVIVLFVLMSAVSAWPQYQGMISGTVRDPDGKPIEKAEVSIVSQKTSTIRYELKTDREGRFVQIGMMPGQYMVSVRKAGFMPDSKEVHVGVAAQENLQISLKSVAAEAEKSYSAADKAFLKGNKLY